jgi:hypothetical protein
VGAAVVPRETGAVPFDAVVVPLEADVAAVVVPAVERGTVWWDDEPQPADNRMVAAGTANAAASFPAAPPRQVTLAMFTLMNLGMAPPSSDRRRGRQIPASAFPA